LSCRGSHHLRVWYVAYGSNLGLNRLRCYLCGGQPPGALRAHPGARDPSDPVDIRAICLDGGLRFAGRSSVWGGAVACYDRRARDRVAARAYLLSGDQVCDVVAQETRRPVGTDPGLRRALAEGSSRFSTGLYDTVLTLGTLRGDPMVTLISTTRPPPGPPSIEYLRAIAAGLSEGFGWGRRTTTDYLLRWPEVAAGWTPAELEAQVCR